MNAEQLNIIARGILQLTGLSPEEIKLQVKEQRNQQKASQSRQAPSVPTRQEVDATRQAKSRYSGKKPTPVTKSAGSLLKESVAESGITGKKVKQTAGAVGALSDLAIRIKNGQDPITAAVDVGLGTALGIGGGMLGSRAGGAGQAAGNIAGYAIGSNLRGTLFGEAPAISNRGEGRAANRSVAALDEPQDSSPAVVSPSKKKKVLSNIPPAEAQLGSPSYVAPPAAASPSTTPTSRLQSSAVSAPAPIRPDYNSMSEMERLKIWATTNRKMIESVGTRQQLQILQRALGGGTTDQQLRDAGQATYNRGSA